MVMVIKHWRTSLVFNGYIPFKREILNALLKIKKGVLYKWGHLLI